MDMTDSSKHSKAPDQSFQPQLLAKPIPRMTVGGTDGVTDGAARWTAAQPKPARWRLLLAGALTALLLSGTACVPGGGGNSSGSNSSGEWSNSSSGQSNGNSATTPPAGTALSEGDLAPDFSFTTIDGQTAKLSDYRGSVVFINLWASWCGPCRNELPDIQTLHQRYPNVVIIEVNVNDNPADAQVVIDNLGLDVHWVLDNGSIARLYPTDGIPYTVIIRPDGVIGTIFVGSAPNMINYFEEAVRAAAISN